MNIIAEAGTYEIWQVGVKRLLSSRTSVEQRNDLKEQAGGRYA